MRFFVKLLLTLGLLALFFFFAPVVRTEQEVVCVTAPCDPIVEYHTLSDYLLRN